MRVFSTGVFPCNKDQKKWIFAWILDFCLDLCLDFFTKIVGTFAYSLWVKDTFRFSFIDVLNKAVSWPMSLTLMNG